MMMSFNDSYMTMATVEYILLYFFSAACIAIVHFVAQHNYMVIPIYHCHIFASVVLVYERTDLAE